MKENLVLNEGDKCLYLSVPQQNDWTKIEFLPGIYCKSNYIKCYVVPDNEEGRKLLNSKIEQIKNLFEFHIFKKACDVPFYRVIVSNSSDLFTVKTLESYDKSELLNQITDYKNNYCKYKSDADVIVDAIKRILA